MLLKKLIQQKNSTWKPGFQVLAVVILMGLIFPLGFGNAADINELKSKITEKSNEMQTLEKEIQKWEGELEVVGKEKKSLNNEIYTLKVTENKLNTNINLTSNQIYSTSLKIEKLAIEIDDKVTDIEKNSLALAEAVRSIHEEESYTILETVLKNKTMSDFWNDLEGLQKIQSEIQIKTNALKKLKADLEIDKSSSEKQKDNLADYKDNLADQKNIVENTKETKNELLENTKNKESNYQEILAEKLALKKAFEAELAEFEEALRIAIDPKSIPNANNTILAWPLDTVRITQFFGNTPFATKNPQVYGGGGHNGVDFGVSTGTKLKTALSGIITATGDTDAACPGASYGKWVLIKHNNGLSTLYGHLSLIKVIAGQTVVTGDTIGYTGNTGYSTGPHLHFTVYATQGVRVQNYNFRSCKGTSTTMPLATKEAYLNPMSYLPEY